MTDKSTLREQQAKQELGQTDISPGLAKVMLLSFLIIIASVPVVQVIVDLNSDQSSKHSRRMISNTTLVPAQPQSNIEKIISSNKSLMNQMSGFETSLKDQSFLRRLFLRPVQFILANYLGAGNEQVYVGKDNWLFYRADFDYTYGREFSQNNLSQHEHSSPYAAISDFARQLSRWNIELVILPTSVKPMIYPEKLSTRYDGNKDLVNNPTFDQLIARLEADGVKVFDPSDILLELKKQGTDSYLKTDTHWTPAAVNSVSKALADYLKKEYDIKPGTEKLYHRSKSLISNKGDTNALLYYDRGQAIYPPETVDIQQVVTTGGAAWLPDNKSEILLLGDSFSNIYSLAQMGWGHSAGLAEQLSFYLQKPVDTICQNDKGADATRQILSRSLKRGNNRLAGKKVLIWQFAIRELADGDWRPIPMVLSQAIQSDFIELSPKQSLQVTGEIAARTASPLPGQVTYKDHVITIHLTNIHTTDGRIENGQAIIYVQGMKDQKLLPAAFWRPGDKVSLKLENWQNHQADMGRLKRSDFSDEKLVLEVPVWGIPDK